MSSWHLAALACIATVGCGDNAHGPTPPDGPPADSPPAGAPTSKVFAGSVDTCVLRPDATLWCWGNRVGVPTQLAGKWKSVERPFGTYSVGVHVVRADGALFRWLDDTGELRAESLDNLSAFASGEKYACWIDLNGTLSCTGNDDSGQLGFGCATSPCVNANTWVALFVSAPKWPWEEPRGENEPPALIQATTCAIAIDGTQACWGAGVPDPTLGSGAQPTIVALGDDYSCVTRADRSLTCSGELDDLPGYPPYSLIFSPTGTLAGQWLTVSTNKLHACGIQTDGSLWCWGRNDYGQLGDGLRTDTDHTMLDASSHLDFTMVQIAGTWTDVSVGDLHTCAVADDESVWCWGANLVGQLGLGTGGIEWGKFSPPLGSKPVPSRLPQGGWASISAGGQVACATKVDGTLWCWGTDTDGELADGRSGYDVDYSFPVDIAETTPIAVPGTSWSTVASESEDSASPGHACATTTDGQLWCWGTGLLGDGTMSRHARPVQVASSGWHQVAVSSSESCATKTDNSLWCWGNDAVVGSTLVSLQVAGSWASVQTVSSLRACALATDGTIWCWGSNTAGEFGNGTTNTHTTSPVEANGSGYVAFTAGDHTCAIKSDTSLWCWGRNDYGQLGDGSTTNRTVPTQIAGLGWTEVSASTVWPHTCAVKTDGTLWCWGHNEFGNLGDGTTTARSVPTQVAGSGWVHVSANLYQTCATKTDGSAWCWGANGRGQLGDNSAWTATPTRVM